MRAQKIPSYPLFQNCGEEFCTDLVGLLTMFEADAGELLCEEGEDADSM